MGHLEIVQQEAALAATHPSMGQAQSYNLTNLTGSRDTLSSGNHRIMPAPSISKP